MLFRSAYCHGMSQRVMAGATSPTSGDCVLLNARKVLAHYYCCFRVHRIFLVNNHLAPPVTLFFNVLTIILMDDLTFHQQSNTENVTNTRSCEQLLKILTPSNSLYALAQHIRCLHRTTFPFSWALIVPVPWGAKPRNTKSLSPRIL